MRNRVTLSVAATSNRSVDSGSGEAATVFALGRNGWRWAPRLSVGEGDAARDKGCVDGTVRPCDGLDRMSSRSELCKRVLSFAAARRCVFLACVLLVCSAETRADAVPCTVDGSPAASEITLTVPTEGEVPLYIICNSALSLPLSLTLTEFVGDAGSIHVNLLLPPDYKTPRGGSPFTIPAASLLPLRLSARSVPPAGKYSGRLIIAAPPKDSVVAKIVLSRGTPNGSLIVTPSLVTLPVTQPLLGWKHDDGPVVTVTLLGKPDQARIEGIRVRLEQVAKQPEGGFSLSRNAAFKFNGLPIAGFEVWPPKQGESDRSIPAGGQALIGVTLKNLSAGEYNTVLRFQGLNSGNEDTQRLTLIVQVRHSIWWAILLLLFAVLFSFVATKVVTSLRHRYVFLDRLRGLRPPWLSQEPPVLAVVRVRASLKLAEDLSLRFWLTGAALIDARVTQVAATLEVLDKVRRLRERVTQSEIDRLPRIRATAVLEQIVARLDEGPPDENTVADLNARLAAFSSWLDPATVNDSYWAEVSAAMAGFRHDVNLNEVEPETARAVLRDLDAAVGKALETRPGDLASMMTTERQYAVLKILWERHGASEFGKLVSIVTARAGEAPEAGTPSGCVIDETVLQEVFEAADRTAWGRLKEAVRNGAVKIVAPTRGEAGRFEAYEPLRFEIRTDDPTLGRTYLFAHGLEFYWRFTLGYGKGAGRGTVVWLPRSSQGRVVQYAPRSGRLKAVVRIEKYGEAVELPAAEMGIASSGDFGTFSGLARVEVMTWALAAGIAVVTGISMFYLKALTFGSVQDYVSLFLWGAGVDQGKNFVQTLQAYSATP